TLKTRDDFIKSVWKKAETAMAEEARSELTEKAVQNGEAGKARRRGRTRWTRWAAAAAACMLLAAGAAGLGGPQAVYDSIFGVGSDSAAMGDAAGSAAEDGGTYEQEIQDIYMAGTTSSDQDNGAPADSGTVPDGSDNVMAMPGMSYDGAFVPDGLNDKDLYGELREQTKSAEEALDSEVGGLMSYYCLPVGVEIQSSGGPEAWAMYATGEEEVMKYMKWFYSLPEEQVLTTEEFDNLKEIPTGYYKFTMDCSMDAETEGSDIVYWLVGEISLP
ncbi:MAG: hypothetical protein II354_00970, partial [Firmicutes bacterium]|nr:hypothetical protein [Bacillota bacterium]